MTPLDADPALLSGATHLSQGAGFPPVRALEPLAGGKNNRVFRAILADDSALVLKSYFHDVRDTRDRLGAEWAFLTHSWGRGVRNVPRPLARDPERHLGLYSCLPGRKLRPGEVTAAHVEAAVTFVLAVNAPPRDAMALPPASEACFSLAQHVATVDRRVGRLGTLDPGTPLCQEADDFVSASLAPRWQAVKAEIEARAGEALGEMLEPEELVMSPSDFGFHNALVSETGIAFLDFEYAGRDDPAKLVCDFFCQPDVPVPIDLFDRTAALLLEGLGLSSPHLDRSRLLLDLYRVKWTCIILNHFLPVGAARRTFAGSAARAKDVAAFQLARATAKLAECRA